MAWYVGNFNHRTVLGKLTSLSIGHCDFSVIDQWKMSRHAEFDVAVIGAGISGIATAKCLLDDKFKIVVYEKTSHIGGLWHFTEDGYGVMSFTHMYVQSRIA